MPLQHPRRAITPRILPPRNNALAETRAMAKQTFFGWEKGGETQRPTPNHDMRNDVGNGTAKGMRKGTGQASSDG